MTLEDALRAVDGIAVGFLAAPRAPWFTGRIPGLAYGVVLGGELVHARGIGSRLVAADGLTPAGGAPDADTVFRIASMTKSFTAAATILLRDEGRLSLDDLVADHVPDLAGVSLPTRDSAPLTIRHLLTMTAGLPTDDPWGDRQQGLPFDRFAELLRGGLTLTRAPGSEFEYSNLGYGILGRVLTRAGGVEYRELVCDRLLGPLGMDSTGYLLEEVEPGRLARGYLWRDDRYEVEPIDGYGALASMGGVFSTVRDLARWVAFFTDAFPARDDPEGEFPLSRASRRDMQQVHRVVEPSIDGGVVGRPTLVETGYGFGLSSYEDLRYGRLIGHSGGYPGYGSHMRWHPASGLGVVVLGNARYAPSSRLAGELLESLLGAGVARPRRREPAPATLAARDVVERLIERWDDALAAQWLAMNVELDEPVGLRRAAFERLRATHGRLVRDEAAPIETASPTDVAWWLRGERGRVRVSMLLSPELPPRVQALRVESVPEPPPSLAAAAAAIVAALARWDADWPATVRLAPTVDADAVRRAFRAIAARLAPVRHGPPVAGDGFRTATWRTTTDAGPLDLLLERAPDSVSDDLTAVSFSPLPLTPPPHDS